jgi:hypothetical protein
MSQAVEFAAGDTLRPLAFVCTNDSWVSGRAAMTMSKLLIKTKPLFETVLESGGTGKNACATKLLYTLSNNNNTPEKDRANDSRFQVTMPVAGSPITTPPTPSSCSTT